MLALIVAVPVTLLQLVVGNRFGAAVTSAQSMKIAASEAQWDTCQPCGFSLIQIGGFTEDDQTPSFSITVPRLLSYMATGSFNGEVQGLTQLQAQEESQFGPGNYMPNVRVIYWSMRVMAYMGMLMFLVAAVGAWLYWKQKLERARWFLRTAIVAMAFPYIAATAGWILTEMGRQPWIVQGLLKTADAHSPVGLLGHARVQPRRVRLPLPAAARARHLADAPLRDARPARARPRRDRRDPDACDRILRWTSKSSGSAWSASSSPRYFLLEGFDFGVGLLLPFLPRNEEERSTMFRTIGPVWDGNEVWLVVAGGAMFAAFPTWYATMFSGFYIALLLLLVFLIVRVLSFEWRERHEHSRWLGLWAWANTIGSLGAALIWGVAFSNLLYGVPINSSGDFDGTFWDLFNLYTLLGGVAVVLLFAFHGATYLTLRTTGELCRRAAAAAGRLSIATAVVGAGFLIWTVAVAVDRNDKDVFPPLLPALLAIVALLGAVVCVRLARSGWAFVLTAAGAFLVVATIFTSLYPRVMVASNDFANSLTVDNASSAHYTLKVMTVVALIVVPIILLYQGWTYHVFRARLSGEEEPSPADLLPRETGA